MGFWFWVERIYRIPRIQGGVSLDRTPLGVANDYQLARHGCVRVRRTNAYTEIVNLPSVEDFIQWDQEATTVEEVGRQKHRRGYTDRSYGTSTTPLTPEIRAERLASLRDRWHPPTLWV